MIAIVWLVTILLFPLQSFAFSGGISLISQNPGISSYLYNHPLYTCVTNYYLSTSGSDSNNGLAPTTGSGNGPWLTPAHAAAQALSPGSCINVAAGVYGQSAMLTISNGGSNATPTGWVVWRASTLALSGGAPVSGEGSGAVIRATASITTSPLVQVTANYVLFDGVELDGNSGDAAAWCLAISPGGSATTPPHHLAIFNSDIHGCGWDGYADVNSDWDWVVHSVVHGNAFANTFPSSCGPSGIHPYEPFGLSGYTPVGLDYMWSASGTFYRHVFLYNTSYDNVNVGCTARPDGVGIELDDWEHTQNSCPSLTGTCPYTSPSLVSGNLMFNNGGPGWRVYENATTTAPITVVGNTSFANNTSNGLGGSHVTEYDNFTAANMTYINNIADATGSNNTFTSDSTSTGNSWHNNLSYPGSQTAITSPNTYPTTGTNPNVDGSSPAFVSATSGSNTQNLALGSGSAARAIGQSFPLWWTGSYTPDAGACPYGILSTCPALPSLCAMSNVNGCAALALGIY